MNKITYRYTVSKQLLDNLEKYVSEKREKGEMCNIDDVLSYFRRLKLHYQIGLAHLD